MPELEAHGWFKSSYSGGSGTECVECAHVAASTLVRDSKCAGGPIVTVRDRPWRSFITALSRDFEGALEGTTLHQRGGVTSSA